MVKVKDLIEKLKKYDSNAIVTIDASNFDGKADAELMVGGETVLGLLTTTIQTRLNCIRKASKRKRRFQDDDET